MVFQSTLAWNVVGKPQPSLQKFNPLMILNPLPNFDSRDNHRTILCFLTYLFSCVYFVLAGPNTSD